jgi:hypothetical protein
MPHYAYCRKLPVLVMPRRLRPPRTQGRWVTLETSRRRRSHPKRRLRSISRLSRRRCVTRVHCPRDACADGLSAYRLKVARTTTRAETTTATLLTLTANSGTMSLAATRTRKSTMMHQSLVTKPGSEQIETTHIPRQAWHSLPGSFR